MSPHGFAKTAMQEEDSDTETVRAKSGHLHGPMVVVFDLSVNAKQTYVAAHTASLYYLELR